MDKNTVSDTNMKKAPKKGAGKLAAEFFIKVALTVLVVWILCTFVIGIFINHSNTCYPMIKDGDLCIAFRHAKIYVDDAVIYKQDGKIRFGRVVAMPQDVVAIDSDAVTVNGYGVYENAVYPTTGEGASIDFPYTVPDDSVFILNDYRSDINDSRTFGAVNKKDIKGKIIFIMRKRGI